MRIPVLRYKAEDASLALQGCGWTSLALQRTRLWMDQPCVSRLRLEQSCVTRLRSGGRPVLCYKDVGFDVDVYIRKSLRFSEEAGQ